jgi:hypothetical protein
MPWRHEARIDVDIAVRQRLAEMEEKSKERRAGRQEENN